MSEIITKRRRPVAPFCDRLRVAVERMRALGRTQADVAQYLRVSQNTVEMWLAGTSVSWGREPDYLTQVGALHILTVVSNNRRRGVRSVVRRSGHTTRKSHENRNVFFRLIGDGAAIADASRSVGVHVTTGHRWMRDHRRVNEYASETTL